MIVILAIIALIAVPIILNIIDNSKESSVLVSGKNYVRALEQQILSKNIKEEFSPEICIIQENGNLMCDGDKPFTVKVSGSKPTSGEIKFNNKKITEVTEMILDGYILEMELDKDLIVKGTTDILEPSLDPKGTYLMVNPYVTKADTYFLGQEQIKRNQIESITVTHTNKAPSNAIYSWDASEAQDGSIISWYTDKDNDNLYELYIGGEGGVKANPNSSSLFKYFNNAITIDVKYLDTSEVTGMYEMFSECRSLVELDLSNFNTSNVTNMSTMFRSCSNLISLDVSSFDTSNVTNMYQMFNACWSLTVLDVSNFNTSKVTTMEYMFAQCYALTVLNLSKFDTSNVTDMSSMFYRSRALTTLNLSSFNINKVTSTYHMFEECKDLRTIMVKDTDAQTWINARLADVNKTGVTVTIA